MPNLAPPLSQISKFVYGTTRLGDEQIPFGDRIAILMEAAEAGAWVHTSDQYGDALDVLYGAVDRDPANPPNQIFKIGWESVDQVRQSIASQLKQVGLQKMTVGQLCLSGALAESLQRGEAECYDLLTLKEEGLVESFVLEVFPWTSEPALRALSEGRLAKLVDALIFYLNPLQRFATNELWDLVVEKDFPVIAMRTVCGGDIHELKNRQTYHGSRANQVLPIYESSGCKSWTEFCVRFAFGFPFVLATVGSTSKPDNLWAFLDATSGEIENLPLELQREILALQRDWSDEVDRLAEPWTM